MLANIEGGEKMSKYTGSDYRKSRRLGFSILETGKELAKRPFAPGQHGSDRAKKLSNYGTQLQEKQKVRFMYGLNEKQFRKTFEEARKLKNVHGEDFLKLLESRLDNLVYRIGFATTRQGARQLVNHGHITVNGKKVNIPAYKCKPGDVIADKEQSISYLSTPENIREKGWDFTEANRRIIECDSSERLAKKIIYTGNKVKKMVSAEIDKYLNEAPEMHKLLRYQRRNNRKKEKEIAHVR
jgi:small subunit ribosomal protein S4